MHGISTTEPLIRSLNSSIVAADDSWSQMVAVAANIAKPCRAWGLREKLCGSISYRSKICVDWNNRRHKNVGKFPRNIISSKISSKSQEKPEILLKFICITFAHYCISSALLILQDRIVCFATPCKQLTIYITFNITFFRFT